MFEHTWAWLLTWFGFRADNRPMPIQDGGETWYTVLETAALLGVSRQRVHELIGFGRLVTKPMGRLVVISKTSIDDLPNTKRRGGRPKNTP